MGANHKMVPIPKHAPSKVRKKYDFFCSNYSSTKDAFNELLAFYQETQQMEKMAEMSDKLR